MDDTAAGSSHVLLRLEEYNDSCKHSLGFDVETWISILYISFRFLMFELLSIYTIQSSRHSQLRIKRFLSFCMWNWFNSSNFAFIHILSYYCLEASGGLEEAGAPLEPPPPLKLPNKVKLYFFLQRKEQVVNLNDNFFWKLMLFFYVRLISTVWYQEKQWA